MCYSDGEITNINGFTLLIILHNASDRQVFVSYPIHFQISTLAFVSGMCCEHLRDGYVRVMHVEHNRDLSR